MPQLIAEFKKQYPNVTSIKEQMKRFAKWGKRGMRISASGRRRSPAAFAMDGA
ncbi:hypothetical protein J7E26_10185 [Bacillus sp. ISL-51]|nr:hypothetical protein [Bacillus sp. ISL-51]